MYHVEELKIYLFIYFLPSLPPTFFFIFIARMPFPPFNPQKYFPGGLDQDAFKTNNIPYNTRLLCLSLPFLPPSIRDQSPQLIPSFLASIHSSTTFISDFSNTFISFKYNFVQSQTLFFIFFFIFDSTNIYFFSFLDDTQYFKLNTNTFLLFFIFFIKSENSVW